MADSEDEEPTRQSRQSLTAAEKQDLTEVFLLCDSDASGLLDWMELRRALRGLGFPVTKREARALVREQQKYNSVAGYIEKSQFYDIVEMLAYQKTEFDREITAGFQLLAGKEGVITLSDLRKVCGDVGERLQIAELEDMIAIGDLNGDGKIDLREFKELMGRTNLFREAGQEPVAYDAVAEV